MIKFRNAFDPPARIHCNHGCGVVPKYHLEVGTDGSLDLVQDGTHDLYSSIQSHADSCNIHVILQRFANGDTAALTKVQGTYGDFTELPTTMAEVLQRSIDAQRIFSELPLDVRSKFDHDVNKFLATAGSQDWLDKMGMTSSPSPEPVPVVDEVLDKIGGDI